MEYKVVLITGTSSGFGLLAAIAFAKKGYKVIATMRDISKSQLLLEKASHEGIEGLIDIRQLDVTHDEEIVNLAKTLLEDYHHIDLLINNAGYALGGFSETLPISAYKEQFQTNVFGLISVTNAFLPYLRKSEHGRIINVSSISGMVGFPGLSPYVASKHAIEGYSECLRFELKPFGINVILIEPGSYDTNVWNTGLSKVESFINRQEETYAEMYQQLYEELNQITKQLGDPKDVIKVMLHAATTPSPKFRYPVGKGVKSSLLLKRLAPFHLWEKLVLKRMNKKGEKA